MVGVETWEGHIIVKEMGRRRGEEEGKQSEEEDACVCDFLYRMSPTKTKTMPWTQPHKGTTRALDLSINQSGTRHFHDRVHFVCPCRVDSE